jgi:ABC-type proline/glycine betaine transport system substrate-binding protein
MGTGGLDIAPECKAVVLVRKGAFKPAKLSTITVARGQIEDNSYAKLVADSILGIRVNLRDMDWTSGLQSMALGQVDGVLVGVERQRPEDLQQVWLGFYELVQLPLTDSEAWSCPRPAS